jgi:hypothetical protein
VNSLSCLRSAADAETDRFPQHFAAILTSASPRTLRVSVNGTISAERVLDKVRRPSPEGKVSHSPRHNRQSPDRLEQPGVATSRRGLQPDRPQSHSHSIVCLARATELPRLGGRLTGAGLSAAWRSGSVCERPMTVPGIGPIISSETVVGNQHR